MRTSQILGVEATAVVLVQLMRTTTMKMKDEGVRGFRFERSIM
jgi:hypothetical protein